MNEWNTAQGEDSGAVFSVPGLESGGERDLCLVVRYDGTDYHGYQRQERSETIQGELERVLVSLFGPGSAIGASRTDAGVHAEGQVVVWWGRVSIPLDRVARVLNGRLPKSIQVARVTSVPQGWDPRRAMAIKQYSYRIWRDVTPPPLMWYRMVHWYSDTLAWKRLEESASEFVGTHDFRAFRSEGSSAATTVRHIVQSQWIIEEEGRMWRYQVVGQGFLYRMVRHMVGGMIQAAGPAGTVELIRRGLGDPERKVTRLAPALGLTLDAIEYVEKEVSHVSGSGTRLGR